MRRKNVTGDMMMDYMVQALLILLRDTPYDRVTVGAIAKKAGVDRSTFYRRFETKEAVIRYFYDQIMSECRKAYLQKGTTDYRVYMLTRFETLYAHREDLMCLHQAGLSHLLFDVLSERFYQLMGTEREPAGAAYRGQERLPYRGQEQTLNCDQEQIQYRGQESVPAREQVEEQFRVSYHLGGIYNNMLLWFSHGMAESPEQMTEIAMSYRPEDSVKVWMNRYLPEGL